jgi:hypothetical protein
MDQEQVVVVVEKADKKEQEEPVEKGVEALLGYMSTTMVQADI